MHLQTGHRAREDGDKNEQKKHHHSGSSAGHDDYVTVSLHWCRVGSICQSATVAARFEDCDYSRPTFKALPEFKVCRVDPVDMNLYQLLHGSILWKQLSNCTQHIFWVGHKNKATMSDCLQHRRPRCYFFARGLPTHGTF